jgi:uncharacterized protein YdeI (YjbR/CyaY-like superfamily)
VSEVLRDILTVYYARASCKVRPAFSALRRESFDGAVLPELKRSLAKNKKAQAAFKELNKGKRREYTDYIADAKRDETKVKRLEKILPMIAAGVGLNDKYRP